MKTTKRKALERAGWRTASAEEVDVSLDLLVRAMLHTGATAREVAQAIAAA